VRTRRACLRRTPHAALLAALLLAMACRESGTVSQHRVPGGDAERGERALVRLGCGSCHVIPGVAGAEGGVGPPLTHFADRSYVAGRLRNEPVALVKWIRDPMDVDSATAMPDLGVTESEARDIAAYLYTLSANRLGPPHLIPQRVITGH
jgi:cytochrome c1